MRGDGGYSRQRGPRVEAERHKRVQEPQILLVTADGPGIQQSQGKQEPLGSWEETRSLGIALRLTLLSLELGITHSGA